MLLIRRGVIGRNDIPEGRRGRGLERHPGTDGDFDIGIGRNFSAGVRDRNLVRHFRAAIHVGTRRPGHGGRQFRFAGCDGTKRGVRIMVLTAIIIG